MIRNKNIDCDFKIQNEIYPMCQVDLSEVGSSAWMGWYGVCNMLKTIVVYCFLQKKTEAGGIGGGWQETCTQCVTMANFKPKTISNHKNQWIHFTLLHYKGLFIWKRQIKSNQSKRGEDGLLSMDEKTSFKRYISWKWQIFILQKH